ncbi:MAG: hypothetical protein WBQ64_06015 [Terriglobales bacterium]
MRPPVSGPSFLGLGDDRTRDLDYLLEDEPPQGHRRLYLALFLLILCGGLLAWHWQRDGYPWQYTPKAAVSNAPVSPPSAIAQDATAAAAPPVVPVEPTANPAPPESQSTPGEGVQSPGTSTAAGQPLADSNIPDDAAALGKNADQASKKQDQNADAGEAETQAPLPAAVSKGSGSEVAEPAPTATKAPKETRMAAVAPLPKAPAPKISPPAPAATFEDRLVADGEKYLYGRGVPEDCARAQRNLQIAARGSNPKAQTLLGAMYATGHCVGRDLPTAYRWFAQALHGDPGNSRVQRDLEVLWKQMTPEERQVAIKSQ